MGRGLRHAGTPDILALQAAVFAPRSKSAPQNGSRFALQHPKAALPPQHRPAQQPFHEVVGRLHALHAANVHIAGSNASTFSQNAATSGSSASNALPATPAADGFPPVSSCAWSWARVTCPSRNACHAANTLFDYMQPAAAHRLTGAAAIHHFLKVPLEVRPTDLPTGGGTRRTRPSGHCTRCR